MSSGGLGEPVLSARGIRVVVEGQRSAALRRRRPARGLEGFSLDVAAGEVVHLVGDPMSGVAEAIEVLSGARVPDAGRLEVEGADVTEPSRRSRSLWEDRTAILGVAPPPSGSRRWSVVDLLAQDVRRAAGERAVLPAHRERADEVMAAVGIPADVGVGRLRDLPAEYAGRLVLARLLARVPAVVVIPSGGRPDSVEEELLDEVLEQLRATGTALVVGAEHLPDRLADHERAVVLCGGRVVEVLGAAGLTHPLHPYTRALAAGAQGATARPDLVDPGCPFRHGCDRAQSRCEAQMPDLVRPLGAGHAVACWFPEDPRPSRLATGASMEDLPPAQPGQGDEPTAHEFVQG